MSELVIAGKRISYIFGGVFCILSAIVAGAFFLPDLIEKVFGVVSWDLKALITENLSDSIVPALSVWGLRVVLILLFVVYDISTCFRQSANSTFLRLAAIFGLLAFLLPEILEMLSDLTDTVDLLQYCNVVEIICFVLGFGFLAAGIIVRAIQKFHPERASTVLVFNAVFWVVCAFFVAFQSLMDILGGEDILSSVSAILLDNKCMLGLLSIFFLVCGAWMLLTIPHKVWRETDDNETEEKPERTVTKRAPIPTPGNAGKVRTLADVDEEAKNADKYTSKKRTISNPYINDNNFKVIPVERPRSQEAARKSGVNIVNSTSKTAVRPNDSGVEGPGFKGGNSGKKTVVEGSVDAPDTKSSDTSSGDNNE